jgi:2-keto-4-pentenoate hydratase/2-oxohepta-3-ene-1,7-dioic acid hydratase in catechol pathway
MKLAQFLEKGLLRLGMIEEEQLFPIDFKGDMIDFIVAKADARQSDGPMPLDQVEFAPAVSRPSKIIGIGLNYMDHIRESKGKAPDKPLLFAKFPNSLAAHGAPIEWKREVTGKVDFEAELAVIMGKTIKDCPESDALDAVFGYTCANDVSARDLQFGDGQWVRGKTLDSFCPLGPWIVTRDEIPDPHSLNIRCFINGDVMQDSNTGEMIFKLPELINFLSSNFTLVPGDVILTGTPHGVGTFRNPSIYLKDGDEVVVEIERVGRLVNPCLTL